MLAFWKGWRGSWKLLEILALLSGGWVGLGAIALAQPADRPTPRSIAQTSNPLTAEATSNQVCAADLPGRLEAIANRPQFQRSRWGILVQTLDEGATLYDREGRRFFVPASNVKLLTTAAGLAQLGPNFRIQTAVYPVPGEANSLAIVGRGDPSITDEQLRELARQLRQRGVLQVDRLIGDDGAFSRDAVNFNWDWGDVQAGYGAAANGLILNRNEIVFTVAPQAVGQPVRVTWNNPLDANDWRIENNARTVAADAPAGLIVERDAARPIIRVSGQMRVGQSPDEESIAIPDPANHFVRRFRRILEMEGIRVRQTVVSTERQSYDGASTLAAIASSPLSELIVPTNRESENIYAESILRQIGGGEDGDRSSLEAGLSTAEATLAQLGVDPEGLRLADGSGLSRHNLVTPEALVQTLRGMARSPHASTYRNSLAVAGVSGTLRNRFRDTLVQGRLWGKTGALSGATALSGYLDPPQYPPLVFSIVLNHFDQPVRAVRPAIDEMVLVLSQLQECSDRSP